MRIALNILAGLLILFGAVWVLQAFRLLPGTFMVGDTRWALYGGAAVILGAALALWNNRRRR